jgi:hypothetical protein
MQRQEIPNNTDSQVEEYVAKALVLVSELDPEPLLRGPVFEKACDLYASKQVVMTQPQPIDLAMLRGNGPRV